MDSCERSLPSRLHESIQNLGLTVRKSPRHSLKASAICERVIGTTRRECLDWLMPMSGGHLRSTKYYAEHSTGDNQHPDAK